MNELIETIFVQIGTGMQVLMTFSACTNLEKLNKPDPTDDMGILHGLRLFSMVFIILGHRCLFTYGGPFFNPEFLEEVI